MNTAQRKLKAIAPIDPADMFFDSIDTMLRVAKRHIEDGINAGGSTTLRAVVPRILNDRALQPWHKWLSVNRLRYVISTFARMGAFENIVLRNGVGFSRRTLALVKS